MTVDRPSPAYFDDSRAAWVLSRFDDVDAALRHPQLVAHGTSAASVFAHRAVRDATAGALSTEMTHDWRELMTTHATRLVHELPVNGEVDLARALFEPWAQAVSLAMGGVRGEDAEQCLQLARTVFRCAADATDGAPRPAGQQAAAALAVLLATESPRQHQAADVQTFIAVSQSLPALLTSVTNALLHDVVQLSALRDGIEHATVEWRPVVAELLRFASPARAVFRVALAECQIGAATIRSGESVTLMLGAANRDPEQFVMPDQLDLRRAVGEPRLSHLALGAGAHRCAGTVIVHLAVEVTLARLLRHRSSIELTDGASGRPWIGGFATRAPAALPVMLRQTS